MLLQIQLLGYNSDLYGNVSQALASNNGLAIIALFGQVSRCCTELISSVELMTLMTSEDV